MLASLAEVLSPDHLPLRRTWLLVSLNASSKPELPTAYYSGVGNSELYFSKLRMTQDWAALLPSEVPVWQ